MILFAVVILLAFSGSVVSEDASPLSVLEICNSKDIECLRRSVQKFFATTYQGLTEYGIVRTDPLNIPSINVVIDSEGVIYKNTNVTVTGLKDGKLYNDQCKLYKRTKVLHLETITDFNIDSDVTVLYTKEAKIFSGHYKAIGSAVSSLYYEYDLQTDDAGVQHFVVGPETITCKIIQSPIVEMNPELQQAIRSDPDIKAFSQDKQKEIVEYVFCQIVNTAYSNIVKNARTSAKAMPASAFFTDLS